MRGFSVPTGIALLPVLLIVGTSAQNSVIKLRSSNLTALPETPAGPTPRPERALPPPFAQLPRLFPGRPERPGQTTRPGFPALPAPLLPRPLPRPFLRQPPSIAFLQPTSAGRVPEKVVQRNQEAIAGVLFSLGKAGGLDEAAEYAQAYVNPDTYELQGGINPLASFFGVEANDTLVQVNTSASYESLEVLLVANNTLAINNATLGLENSTLWLAETSWLKIAEGASLDLSNSRLNVTNFFTWYVDGSSVASNRSILETLDALTWFNASILTLKDSTFVTGSASRPEPELFEGKLPIVFAATDSTLELEGTSWEAKDIFLHLNGSQLSLFNSTITLRNATLDIWDSVLELNNSEILLYNSTIGLYGTTQTVGDIDAVKIYDAASITGPALVPPQAVGGPQNITQALLQRVVGRPLGALPFGIVDADADLFVENAL